MKKANKENLEKIINIQINSKSELVKNEYISPRIFIIDLPNEKLTHTDSPDYIGFLSGIYEYESPWISISNDKLIYIAMPRAPAHELYFCTNKIGDTLFTSDFYTAIHFIEKCSIDDEARTFFLNNAIFPPGKTLFKEIKRVLPGTVTRFGLNADTSKVQCGQKIESIASYEEFKRRFELYIKHKVSDKNVGVLLSGGVDSTSIAIAAKKYAKNVHAFSMNYSPAMKGVLSDLAIAKRTSKALDISLKVCDVDFQSYDIERFKKFVAIMPMGAGLPTGFDLTVEKVKSENIDCVLTGQNADLLYNMSATSKFSLSRSGIAALFRRIFLTEEYFKYLDCKQNRSLRYLLTPLLLFLPLEKIGAVIYSWAKGCKYRPPKSNAELLYVFERNSDVVVFTKEQDLDLAHNNNPIHSNDVHFQLIQQKIEKDMMLPDSQIIRRSGDLWGVDIIFPFSCETLMPIWLQKKMHINDIFSPKKYIYRYVLEHYPEYFQEIEIKKDFSHGYDAQDWAERIVRSDFGRSLSNNLLYPPSEKLTKYKLMTYYLSNFWINSISTHFENNPSTKNLDPSL